MTAFAVFSLGLFFAAPAYSVAANLALVLFLINTFIVDDKADFNKQSPDGNTLAGAMQAATLLWLSTLAGGTVVAGLGVTDYAATVCLASVISLALFSIAIIIEIALSIVLQFVITGAREAPTRIARLIDAKYAGFLGNIQ